MPSTVINKRWGRWWLRVSRDNFWAIGFLFTCSCWCPALCVDIGRWSFSLDRMLSDAVDVDWGPEKEFIIQK